MMPTNNGTPGSSRQHYAPTMQHQNQHMYPEANYQSTSFQPPPQPTQYDAQQFYEPMPHPGNYVPQCLPQSHSLGSNYQPAPSVASLTPAKSTGAGSDDEDPMATDEVLGRESPEEFPEYVPGAWDEIRKQRVLTPGKPSMRFRTELDASDVKLVNELGQLTVDNLLDYMKNLQNNAYVLGEEEAKEFQRSKNLGFYKK